MMKKKWITRLGIVSIIVLLALGGLSLVPQEDVSTSPIIGIGQRVLVIGPDIAYAAGTPDYTCDGVNDDVQFQAALDALPAGGGKIAVLSGTYVFSAAVSRAIDDVTIEGVGKASYITRDGVNPLFDVGTQDNWVFRDISFDAGDVDVSDAACTYLFENVWIGATYYGYRPYGDFIPSVNATIDLGSPTYQWKDLYVAGGTIHLGASVQLAETGGTNLSINAPTDIAGNVGIDSTVLEVSNHDPQLRITENDQIAPAGLWRLRESGDTVYWERATAADWSADEDWLVFNKGAEILELSKNVVMADGTLYFYDVGGEHIVSDGSNLTITGATIFPNTVYFYDAGGESILSNGSLLTINGVTSHTNAVYIGHTATRSKNVPGLEVNAGTWGGIACQAWTASSVAGAIVEFNKSNGAIGTHTVIVTGNRIGYLQFNGSDGVDWQPAAGISVKATGTIGNNRVPGLMEFDLASDIAASAPLNVLSMKADDFTVSTSDAAQTAAVTRLNISGAAATGIAAWTNVYHTGLKLGLAGTATGAMTIDGATSGVVTLTVAAAAGTWAMTLPAAVGTAGYFLVDAAGDGITSWSNSLPTVTTSSYIEFTEMAAPGVGAANTARIYALEDGGTLTDLAAVFQDGTVEVFAQEVTPLDAPTFRYPSNTMTEVVLKKPHPGLVQFFIKFPDGTLFPLKDIQYHDAAKIAANQGTEGPLPADWVVTTIEERVAVQVDKLNAELSEIESRELAIGTDIFVLEAENIVLDSSIHKAETDIADLEAELATAQDIIDQVSNDIEEAIANEVEEDLILAMKAALEAKKSIHSDLDSQLSKQQESLKNKIETVRSNTNKLAGYEKELASKAERKAELGKMKTLELDRLNK